jgi:myo-inositol-1(or 4)-monophosphatase
MNFSKKELQTLQKGMIRAAYAGGKVLMHYFGKRLHVREKFEAGLVSEADTGSEKVIIRTLKQLRPDFSFLAEESGTSASSTENEASGRWIIDPLDGTTNFVHGFPMFCVSIAAEWKNQIIAGVIYSPVFKETFTAVKGQGAWLNGKRIRASGTKQVRDALLATGFGYRKGNLLKLEVRTFERLSKAASAIRRPGSAALDLANTARGIFDGFWERKLSPWDVAAGSLIVQEAGGKVTDFKGNSFNIHVPEILASGPKIHGELLGIIRNTRSSI